MENMRIIVLIAFLISGINLAGQSIHYNLKGDYVANGYDVVSYFDNMPTKGQKEFEHTHDGIKLKFSSQSNLDQFKSNPEKYLPQYGGWCSYAIAKNGEKVKINPKTYEIRDNKLYLFYNKWGTNTLKKWKEEDPSLLQPEADKNWEAIKHKKN